MIARNIAPGLDRHFRVEEFPFYKRELLLATREEAKKKIYPSGSYSILASDTDEGMIKIAKENAKRAGVLDDIQFSIKDFLTSDNQQKATIVTNPPYGNRLQ